MSAIFKKIFHACILGLVVFTTGAWQSAPLALAQSQNTSAPEAPLYPGLTWSSLGSSPRDITINIQGDTISLLGEGYAAKEQLASSPSREISNYYSNEQLAKSGWESYDTFENSDGVHYIYYHTSGIYLAVEFLKCSDVPSNLCVTVWKSNQTDVGTASPAKASDPKSITATAGTFGKISPVNGATNLNPTNVVLTWGAYSPTPDKYSYCIKEGAPCVATDPGWTGTYTNTSITLTNLAYDKTYYWQIKAITCVTCVPKTYVYADNGTFWTLKTKLNTNATILGNAGVAGATLSYTDGTPKTVTADGTGAYSITVPLNWSGTVTPSKSGYLFTPKSASFSNLTAAQTIQNFTATVALTISGNVGVSGATLSYTDGTPQTATSDISGNYSIIVPYNWSGTITPSKPIYSFSPVNRTYVNITTNQTSQNYTATLITYSITGNAGLAGATLAYTDNGPKSVMADGSGSYTIIVPSGWTGTVTPKTIGYQFTPANRSYTNVQSNQAAQNYTASVCANCADKDTVGVFRPSNGLLYLKNLNVTGFADVAINYGLGGDYPVVGDWDGNGTDTIGVYRNGVFYLRNSNTIGNADLTVPFGSPGDQPIAGDWNNDGTDTIGVYRSSTATFLLRNTNTPGVPDVTFALGNPGDVAIAGDWNGDGTDTTGVFRPSNGVIFLKNTNTSGIADVSLNYGMAGDRPVVGDWDNNGTTTIGIYRNARFYLRNSNTNGFADIQLDLGNVGDMPIAGNWDAKP
jgi:hypothetical protein